MSQQLSVPVDVDPTVEPSTETVESEVKIERTASPIQIGILITSKAVMQRPIFTECSNCLLASFNFIAPAYWEIRIAESDLTGMLSLLITDADGIKAVGKGCVGSGNIEAVCVPADA